MIFRKFDKNNLLFFARFGLIFLVFVLNEFLTKILNKGLNSNLETTLFNNEY